MGNAAPADAVDVELNPQAGVDEEAEKSSQPRSAQRSSGRSRHRSSRDRRQEKKRKRERRRVFLAMGLVVFELLGFSLANFSAKDSWAELGGFLLLQPVQIVLNGLDARFQFTRGLRDPDAVLLVTLLSLPLNLLFWYGMWRGWRWRRRQQRRRRHAPGGTHGPALSVRRSGKRPQPAPRAERTAVAAESSILAEAQSVGPKPRP